MMLTKMNNFIKRYGKLLLISLTFFSVLLNFWYEMENRKLRDAFEVLDSFGISSNLSKTDCMKLHETRKTKNLYLFSEPGPQWIDVGGDYVYSAFWQDKHDYAQAIAIGVGPNESKNDYQCHVWFDYANIIHSADGEFESKIISHNNPNSSVNAVEFMCRINDKNSIRGKPYMFVFIHKKGLRTKKSMVPIFTMIPYKHHDENFAICVKPDYQGFQKADLISFVTFHKLVGLTDLIVYDNIINYGIISKIKQLIEVNSYLHSLTMLSWQFPYDDKSIEAKIIELDCLFRVDGYADVSAVLDWNQYIIPKQQNSLLNTLQAENVVGSQKELSLQSQLCCLDLEPDHRFDENSPNIFLFTKCIIHPMNFQITKHPIVELGEYNGKTHNLGTVNTYGECNEKRKDASKQYFMKRRFSLSLLSNELWVLWHNGNLFI